MLKMNGSYGPPLLKYLATPLLALVVGEENLVIGFGPPPPHFRNAFAIADPNPKVDVQLNR